MKKITKTELINKAKEIFTLDDVKDFGNAIYIDSTYEYHMFTYGELKSLFELAIRYNFVFSIHEKDEIFNKTHIYINLKNSLISCQENEGSD